MVEVNKNLNWDTLFSYIWGILYLYFSKNNNCANLNYLNMSHDMR